MAVRRKTRAGSRKGIRVVPPSSALLTPVSVTAVFRVETASTQLRHALLVGMALAGAVTMPSERVAAADLDLNGVSRTLPVAGSFGGGAFLTGADNLTNSGAANATLTQGGGAAGNIYAGNITNGATNTTGIIHTGGFVTLTGSNTYAGGTTINAGELRMGNPGALGTGAVTFAGTSTLGWNVTATVANNHIVSPGVTATIGAASGQILTLTGFGQLNPGATLTFGSATLKGTVVFSPSSAGLSNPPSLVVGGGALKVGSSTGVAVFGAAAVGMSVNVNAGATLDVNGLSIALSRFTNNGTLANSGANSTVTFNGTAANLGGTVDTGANNLTFAGLLGGTSSFTKTGAGTLTFASFLTNTHTGGMTLLQGALSLQGNLASTFGTITTTGSVIDYANGVTSAAPINLNSNSTQLQVTTGTATQSGVISETTGPRPLEKIGSGTLILSGVNTYTGATTVTAGTLTNSGTIAGALNNAATFNNNASGTVSGLLTNTAGTATNAGQLNGGATVSGGALTNNNTITGTVGVSGAGTVVNNATITGAVNNAATFNNNAGGTVSGLHTNTAGTTTNAGQLNGGANISGGTLQIGAGGTSGGIAGNIANNGTLVFNRSDALTVSGAIYGTGTVQQTGSGTTILTGANSYSGTTTITAGTLQVGAGGTTGTLGTGNVVNNGTLAFNRSDAFAVANNISGTGAVTQAGTGTGATILTGANSYSGTTTITVGTLQVGAGGTTGMLGTGSVVNNGALAFNRSDAFAVANNMSGTGGINQNGTGATILTGANSYSGTTTITAGTLQVGAGGTTGTLGTGNVVNNGTLAFNRSDAFAVANNISGTGGINQNGTSVTTLIGASNYSGSTNVNAGTLRINGSITGPVNVGASGTLGGTGSMGIVTFSGGGIFDPGASIGTTIVNGSLTLNAASTTNIEFSTTASDRIVVNGAATLAGTVRAIAQPGTFTNTLNHTFLTSTGRAGAFNGVTLDSTINPQLLQLALSYTTTDAILNVTPVLTNALPAGSPINAQAIATGINTGVVSFGGFGGLTNLLGVPTVQLPGVLTALSGENFTAVQEPSLRLGSQFGGALLDQLSARRAALQRSASAAERAPAMALATADPIQLAQLGMSLRGGASQPQWNVWGAGHGGHGGVDGNVVTGSSKLNYSTWGGAAGVDFQLSRDLIVGVAASDGKSRYHLDAQSGSGRSDLTQLGIYASYRAGAVDIDGMIAYGAGSQRTTRTVAGAGPTELLRGEGDLKQTTARLKASLSYGNGNWTIAPYAGLQAVSLHTDAIREVNLNGPTQLGLNVDGRTVNTYRSMLGAQLNARVALGAMDLKPFVRAEWAHDFRTQRVANATFQTLPTAGFLVQGARPAKDVMGVTAGAELIISKGVALYASVDGEFSGRSNNYAMNAGVRVSW